MVVTPSAPSSDNYDPIVIVSFKDPLTGRPAGSDVRLRILATAEEFVLAFLLSNVSHLGFSQQRRGTPLMSGRSVVMGSIGYARVRALAQNT